MVDPQIAVQSPKGYSQRELQEIAATVPSIYDLIAEGASEQDFLNMRLSAEPNDRKMGDTYAQLFRDSPSSNPLAATYDGTDLVVEKGNHRVRAARDIGVPVLPVWVRASSEAELDHVERACTRRIEREGASAYRDAHLAYQKTLGYERVSSSRERALGETLERGRSPER